MSLVADRFEELARNWDNNTADKEHDVDILHRDLLSVGAVHRAKKGTAVRRLSGSKGSRSHSHWEEHHYDGRKMHHGDFERRMAGLGLTRGYGDNESVQEYARPEKQHSFRYLKVLHDKESGKITVSHGREHGSDSLSHLSRSTLKPSNKKLEPIKGKKVATTEYKHPSKFNG